MIKINKQSNVLLVIILVLIIINTIFGNTICYLAHLLIAPAATTTISLWHLSIFSIDNIIRNSTGIIIAIFFIHTNSEPKENKIFWATAAFLFGLPALILYLIKKVIESVDDKLTIQRSIKTILIVVICILPIEYIYNFGIKTLMINIVGSAQYGQIMKFEWMIKATHVFSIAIFNIWLSVKVHQSVKEKGHNSFVWWFSTLFLNIIPIILFDIMEFIKNKNTKVVPPELPKV